MLNVILIAIAVFVVLVLLFAASKPNTFRVQRQAVIKAKPDAVFAQLDDFHKWARWSPWEKLDPMMTRNFSGADSGKGSIYEWEGNKKVGQGRMEITDLVPNAQLLIKLDFFKPFEAHNTAEFVLESIGDSTNITWTMHGPASFAIKVMHVFMNMDKMVGKDFEAGLANLKSIVEK
jgi:hypothetical protein